jgi:hypothetical protein
MLRQSDRRSELCEGAGTKLPFRSLERDENEVLVDYGEEAREFAVPQLGHSRLPL